MLLEKKLINWVPGHKNGTTGTTTGLVYNEFSTQSLQNGQPRTVNPEVPGLTKNCVYRKPDIREEH